MNAQSCIVLNLPQKLDNYRKKVEKETERQTCIARGDKFKIAGAGAEWKQSDSFNLIMVNQQYDTADPAKEWELAHELTHGRIIYARHYLHFNSESTDPSTNLIENIVSDLVVNKIIRDDGFDTIPVDYIERVRQATSIISVRAVYPYLPQPNDPVFRSRSLVAQYLNAWGFFRYYRLDTTTSDTLNAFLIAFQRAFPAEFEMAKRIQSILERYDIFKSSGYRAAIEECLRLWGLENPLKDSATN
jgi:hypothetical protein